METINQMSVDKLGVIVVSLVIVCSFFALYIQRGIKKRLERELSIAENEIEALREAISSNTFTITTLRDIRDLRNKKINELSDEIYQLKLTIDNLNREKKIPVKVVEKKTVRTPRKKPGA